MESGFSLIELFKLGGPFMWVLLAFSVATVAIIIERLIYITWHDCKVAPISKRITDFFARRQKRRSDSRDARSDFPS